MLSMASAEVDTPRAVDFSVTATSLDTTPKTDFEACAHALPVHIVQRSDMPHLPGGPQRAGGADVAEVGQPQRHADGGGR